MPVVRRLPRVERDLNEIVRYIARDKLSAALSWLETTEALFSLLAAHPELGQLYQTKRFKHARRHAHGNYVVVFGRSRAVSRYYASSTAHATRAS